MERYNIDESFDKVGFIFKTSGVDVRSRSKIRTFVYIFNLFWLWRDWFGALYYLLEGIKMGQDFVNLTYIAPCVTFCLLASFKTASLLLNKNQAYEILHVLRNLEEKERKREKNLLKKNIVEEEQTFLHLLLKVLNIAYLVLMVMFGVNALLIMAYKYWKNGVVEYVLPFLIKYPFDAYDKRYWPAVFLHQVWSEIVVIVFVMSSDYHFYVYCTYIKIQFRLLQQDLRRLLIGDTFQDRDDMQNEFRELVVWHQVLIRSVQMLEALYSKSILLNFVISSILICLTGFDVMVISDVVIVLSFVSFLSTSLMQIFILCFFGDSVMQSSMEVGNAIYESEWYLRDATFNKNLLIMITRSQRACKFTAYGFADVNLRSFMRVLSNAWSYFALLNTIYG